MVAVIATIGVSCCCLSYVAGVVRRRYVVYRHTERSAELLKSIVVTCGSEGRTMSLCLSLILYGPCYSEILPNTDGAQQLQ